MQLTGFLSENKSALIEFFQGVDLGFMLVGPLVVAVEGFGYSINGEISFQQPIGLEVNKNLKLDDESGIDVIVNYRNIKMSKIVIESSELESDLNRCLKILEKIVNQTSIMLDTLVEQIFMINSEWLDKQLGMMLRKEELEKRGEVPRPFGAIHAKSSRDVKERAGDLIPLYKERDKTYLYDAKRVYFLLPHGFVVNLLRCDGSTMVKEEEFDKRGKEVLRDLVYKKYLRRYKTLDGTVCYYGLNEKTRRYLTKHLEHKTSRL